MNNFVQSVKEANNQILESIKYVEYNGTKYIVDGHHRYFTAAKLGISEVPIERVELPYGGYQTVSDLVITGKQPGWCQYFKP